MGRNYGTDKSLQARNELCVSQVCIWDKHGHSGVKMQPCKTASAVHDCACCVGRRQQAYLSQKPWPDVELCSDRHAQTEQLSPACARLHLEQARARAEEIRRTAWIPALGMLAVRQSCLKVEEAEAGSFRETRPPRVSGNAERACSKAELQSRRTQERSACHRRKVLVNWCGNWRFC